MTAGQFLKLSICKVWDAEYPWDVRVEKIAGALTDRGHAVHIVARNRDARPLEEGLPEGIVHRMPPIPALGRRLDAATMFPAFFNPRWVQLIRRTCRQTAANLILCRDLPLAPTAIYVGRSLGVPVILDMAEDYAAMVAEIWQAGNPKPLDWLVRNPSAVAAVERWVMKRIHHTLVVVEESRDRLVQAGAPAERITVVSNTPPLRRLTLGATAQRPAGDARDIELVYLGLLEAARGIGVLLDAVARCRDAGKSVRLSVYGDGRDASSFRLQADRLSLSTRVRFHGHVPYEAALDAIQRADLGVVPHHAVGNWNTSIPNKLFDYMAAGLPVITSDARPAARIVRETRCGEVFRDRDCADLVGSIDRLLDPARRAEASAAGRSAIATKYHWEREVERLVEAVESSVRGALPRVADGAYAAAEGAST